MIECNLKQITDKKLWNNFIIDNFKFYSFLDSWQWWVFNELEWNKVFRFWIYWKKENLIWLIMLIYVQAKRGSYFFTPHWPLIVENYFNVLKSILPKIKTIASKNNASFLRINTLSENKIENKKSYKKLWFIEAPMHVHAENTNLLDLKKSEEQLLASLRKTTRYLINRAKKEWVEIIEDKSTKSIDNLLKMHKFHAKRKNWKNTYSAFSEKYIKNLLEVFDDDQITVMNAIYQWCIEASLLTIKFWKICVYYIWASDIKHPKFSPAYLLQFSAILKAKSDWCLLYNFWWVSPDNNPKHPIQWVTMFKRGFWWYDYDLLHAQDFVFNMPRYIINFVIETMRRKKRWYYYKDPV